jgi:hypothetical protein
MSGSRVYEFHQQEVDDLKAAAIYTLAVCTNLKRMLEGIHDAQPRWASRGIHDLLDLNYQCKPYVDKVVHLLAPVSVPVTVPIRTKMHRGSDGIHYEDVFPLEIELREEPLAHLAAWVIQDTVVSYLWSVWRRGNTGLIYCDALEATYELVGPRWYEIREELKAFVDYDYYGLRKAIEDESKAAIALCRQTMIGAIATHEPNDDEPPYLEITLGDREAVRIVGGQECVAEFSKKEKPWDLLKVLIEAGGEGIHRQKIEDQIGASLDKHKAMLLTLIEPLNLDIDLERGIWTLKSM